MDLLFANLHYFVLSKCWDDEIMREEKRREEKKRDRQTERERERERGGERGERGGRGRERFLIQPGL